VALTGRRCLAGGVAIAVLLGAAISCGRVGGPSPAAFRRGILGRAEEKNHSLNVSGTEAVEDETEAVEDEAEAVEDEAEAMEDEAPPCKNEWSKEWPSLFCFAVMMPKTYEEAVIKSMVERRAAIYACNDAAIISREEVWLGKDNCDQDVMTWVNPVPEVGKGQYGVNGQTTSSFLNTQIFRVAWGTLIESGKLWDHDFTVKVDPDAVFFPDRLRNLVREHSGSPVFFTTCESYGKHLLYGSLEVFSKEAVGSYKDVSAERCTGMDWSGMGEDIYMQKCMEKCGVTSIDGVPLVGDENCNSAPCSDGSKAAFHAFKDNDAYWNCWDESAR